MDAKLDEHAREPLNILACLTALIVAECGLPVRMLFVRGVLDLQQCGFGHGIDEHEQARPGLVWLAEMDGQLVERSVRVPMPSSRRLVAGTGDQLAQLLRVHS